MRDREDADFKNLPLFDFAGCTKEALVTEVYDGDTITVAFPVRIDLGPLNLYKFKTRINRIDCPEIRPDKVIKLPGKNKTRARKEESIKKEKALACFVRDRTREKLITKDQVVLVHIEKMEKYGRLLADITFIDDSIRGDDKRRDLADWLLATKAPRFIEFDGESYDLGRHNYWPYALLYDGGTKDISYQNM